MPGDVSIMGASDLHLSRILPAELTTITQDPRASAVSAVRLALEQIHGQRPRNELVAPRLVINQTTGPATCGTL